MNILVPHFGQMPCVAGLPVKYFSRNNPRSHIMARKPTGRPTGRPKKIIDWKKFEFDCQINATKEEIYRCLNISESTLDAECSAHYDRMVGITLLPARSIV
jgi:hypothetical protein